MPSPGTSPIPMSISPSAIRNARDLVSPTSVNNGITSQWTISNIPISLPGEDESPDDLEQVIEPPIQNRQRRSLMSVMRNVVANSEVTSRRRNSRNSQTPGQTGDDLFNNFVMQFAGSNGASGFEAIANNINANQRQVRTDLRQQSSQLRNKIVYILRCSYCFKGVCNRAMKAILLADTKIELFSTDIPPQQLQLMEEDRITQGCHCRIRDTVCSSCGNVLGYHVSQPCDKCLDAKNNGHFWMFYSETVTHNERMDSSGTGKPLFWGSLIPMRETEDPIMLERCYDLYCR